MTSRHDRDSERILSSLPASPPRERPSLVVLCGLPGAGKSHLRRALNARTRAVGLESDALRRLLVGTPTYTPAESARLFSAMRGVANRLLTANRSVVIDATNLTERERRPWYRLAKQSSVKLLLVNVIAPESIIRQRLEARFTGAAGPDNSDAGIDVYERMASVWRPIRLDHYVVDTTTAQSEFLELLAKAMEAP